MSSNAQPSRTAARKLNEQAVLATIFRHGPLSRVSVAGHTGLSKPTVNSIVDDLVGSGLVEPSGRTSGSVGRTATLFHIDGSVAHVIALDVGGRNVRVAVADIYGRIVGERTARTKTRGPKALVSQIQDVVRATARDAGVPWDSVRVIAVGLPGAVDHATGRVRLAPNIPSLAKVDLAAELGAGDDLEVLLENDVNLAAVGERWQGLAREVDNFVFIAVGTGIGAGIFIDGKLCRGAGGGAAGEIGYLPLGADPFQERHRVRGALEDTVSGPGIAAEAQRRIGPGVDSVLGDACDAEEVFRAAGDGDALALDVLDHVARHLALAVSAVATVVSPELVILGGGVGGNEALLDPVRAYVAQLLPQELRIERSALDDRAARTGALALALDAARASVLSLPGAGTGEPPPDPAGFGA